MRSDRLSALTGGEGGMVNRVLALTPAERIVIPENTPATKLEKMRLFGRPRAT